MKIIILLLFLISHINCFSQSFSQQYAVLLDAEITNANSAIKLSWGSYPQANQYSLFRRDYGSQTWSSLLATLPGTETEYTDNTVSIGQKYEYRIIRNSNTTGYGYVLAGIDTDINHDPGILILVIDDYFLPSLQQKIDTLISDIEGDGWFVHPIVVNRNETSSYVKSLIAAEYILVPQRVKSIFLLGHVPVPYSGNMNLDGHSDHQGAWPADVYYGDMDAVWSDSLINITSANSVRNHNIPGDGKFDQLIVQNVELEVSRVDFHDLPLFSSSETELMSSYLTKLHEFKTHLYIPLNTALIEDNFLGYQEGFASGGYISFAPIVGKTNVVDGDYSSVLMNNDYLWSYGTGPGTYISAQGIISSDEFNSTSVNSTFTMLFGSYFGDWDSQNNLLRSALASGRILCSSWSGRPNLLYHPMGLGENIGSCIRISQNNTINYFSTVTSNFKRSIHIAQLGDVTLRAHYVDMPSNLITFQQSDGSIQLNWTAPLSAPDGYFIYRRAQGNESWIKLNTTPITVTNFIDLTFPISGQYEYMVRSVQLLTTGSGRFRNQSLGIKATANSEAALEAIETPSFGPNPFGNELKVWASNCQITIMNILGQIMYQSEEKPNEIILINTIHWPKGIYFLSDKQTTQRIIKR
ncbi:MAG: T9SS type A sorting domain-containing protein [Bacteroidota bacterium]